jgi:anaerobic magnesium-protoporphyrin IX monomethyl ester cyclase
VDSVAYELVQLRREHDVELVAFYDPAPAADARRFAELTERLVELDLGLEIVIWSSVADILRDEAVLPRWRSAGVVHVGICREPSEDRLEGAAMERSLTEGRRAVRALRHAGITCETSFWLGFPDETPATVDEGPTSRSSRPCRTRRRGEPMAPMSSPATTVATTTGTRW